MTLTIRKMEENDIEQVQNAAKASWHSTYEGIIPREVQDQFLAAAYSSERMLQRIERSHLFVAEAEGQIVGFANFSPVNKEGKAELGAIYLYSEAQGKGIGTSLLNKGIEELAGVKEIYINVEKDMKSAGIFIYQKVLSISKSLRRNLKDMY